MLSYHATLLLAVFTAQVSMALFLTYPVWVPGRGLTADDLEAAPEEETSDHATYR